MKSSLIQSYRILIAVGVILSFSFSISILPFSQTKNFQRISYAKDSYHALKTQTYGTEYNLNSILHTNEEVRLSESRENADYLHFLTFIIPNSQAFLQYYNKNNFPYAKLSILNYKLHSIPPPFVS
jgi:hypothetical protein